MTHDEVGRCCQRMPSPAPTGSAGDDDASCGANGLDVVGGVTGLLFHPSLFGLGLVTDDRKFRLALDLIPDLPF